MLEIYRYRIEVQGRLDDLNFNRMSPYLIADVLSSPDATLFSVCADQSGLVGLLRHLHQQGYVILSLSRKGGPAFNKEE